jgi:hypothetical protein
MSHKWKPGDHATLTFNSHTCTLVKRMPFGGDYWWVKSHDGKWKGTVCELGLRPIDKPAPAEVGAQLTMF